MVGIYFKGLIFGQCHFLDIWRSLLVGEKMSYRIYVGKLENFQSMVDSTKKPNIVRQYVPRVEVGRGLVCIEDSAVCKLGVSLQV